MMPIPPSLKLWSDLCDIAEQCASETAQGLRERCHRSRRRARAVAARVRTPCWNQFAILVASRLTRRGDQSRLARHLGIPRQRIHEYVIAGTARPTAEETLRLLIWLARKDVLPRQPPRIPPDLARVRVNR
jgi:hypothetical protein